MSEDDVIRKRSPRRGKMRRVRSFNTIHSCVTLVDYYDKIMEFNSISSRCVYTIRSHSRGINPFVMLTHITYDASNKITTLFTTIYSAIFSNTMIKRLDWFHKRV